jgi:hypothetical protein
MKRAARWETCAMSPNRLVLALKCGIVHLDS